MAEKKGEVITIRGSIKTANEFSGGMEIDFDPQKLETFIGKVKAGQTSSGDIGTREKANTCLKSEGRMQVVTRTLEVGRREGIRNLGFSQKKQMGFGRLEMLMNVMKIRVKTPNVREMDRKGLRSRAHRKHEITI